MRLALSRRADYAVRAILALAEPGSAPRLSSRRIAERMAIPQRFLPQVMRDLAASGIVRAHEGRRGGYELARDASEISLLEVITAAEGDGGRQTCVLRGGPCGADGECVIHPVLASARAAILERLAAAPVGPMARDLPPPGTARLRAAGRFDAG